MFGVIAVVSMLVSRIKILFRAFRECKFTADAARESFRAMVADARARPGSFLLGLTVFCAFVLFAEYVLLALVAFGVVGTLLSAIVKWRAAETAERPARHLSRPLFHG